MHIYITYLTLYNGILLGDLLEEFFSSIFSKTLQHYQGDPHHRWMSKQSPQLALVPNETAKNYNIDFIWKEEYK